MGIQTAFAVTGVLLSGSQGAKLTSKSWVVVSISGANKNFSGQMTEFIKAVIYSDEVLGMNYLLQLPQDTAHPRKAIQAPVVGLQQWDSLVAGRNLVKESCTGESPS